MKSSCNQQTSKSVRPISSDTCGMIHCLSFIYTSHFNTTCTYEKNGYAIPIRFALLMFYKQQIRTVFSDTFVCLSQLDNICYVSATPNCVTRYNDKLTIPIWLAKHALRLCWLGSSTFAFYVRGPRFKPRPGDRRNLLTVFVTVVNF